MTTQPSLDPAAVSLPRRRSLIFLGAAVACVGATMAFQMGLNTNFLVEEIGVSGFEQGLLESVRESCGVVAFGVLAILAGFAEPLVGAAMLLLLAAGLAAYAGVHSYWVVVLLSVVWSQGLHVWMPLPQSMTLALAEPGRTGHRLGQIGAAGSAGWGLGLGAALLLGYLGVSMRPMYLVAGGAAALGAVACLGINRQVKTPGPRLVFSRRYRLYYLLCFLEGWRKQIFICFAGFLLVKIYGVKLPVILGLFAVVQVISFFAAPRVGRLIDRLGERRILVVYFATLIAVFLGYALIPNLYVLYALFVVDGVVWTLAMALTTYVNRIAPPSEHTPTLSMGVAMNHVAAVTMPLAGGLLWTHLGYQWTFALGAFAAAISIAVALRVPKHQRAAPAVP
ncbi:MAG: MFS transporter [Planctomycetota bacterium]|nr:MFS transporter [Planctomycetota bacterium]